MGAGVVDDGGGEELKCRGKACHPEMQSGDIKIYYQEQQGSPYIKFYQLLPKAAGSGEEPARKLGI